MTVRERHRCGGGATSSINPPTQSEPFIFDIPFPQPTSPPPILQRINLASDQTKGPRSPATAALASDHGPPQPRNKATLPSLPPELLDKISSHLPLATDYLSLSGTSRSLHSWSGGSSSFLSSRFPSASPVEDDVRTATTAARNLVRRGWYATTCLPGRRTRMLIPGSETKGREGPWRAPAGQSMGFVPAVSPGGKGRVAVGAGAEVLLRTEKGGWVGYRPEGVREGRDDVISVQLLESEGGMERVLVGTAAGKLDVLRLRTGEDWMEEYEVLDSEFSTEGMGVRDTALRPDGDIHGGTTGERSLVSAVIGQDSLALYDLTTDSASSAPTGPLGKLTVTSSSERRSQAWRTNWLNPTTVAVTLSSARHPIQLYDVRPTGFSDRPISRIAIHPSEARTVYPIEPLHNIGGRVFASGGYDGVVRVHDTRCSDRSGGVQYAAREEAEYGAIYSLLSRPGHHLLAGTAQFDVLSVLDLRTKGFLKIPLVHSDDAGTAITTPESLADPPVVKGFDASTVGCYDYRTAKGGRSGSYYLYMRDRGGRFEGPVYNLSSPSPYSPLIYIGLENSVVQLCLHGVADAHPDRSVTGLLDTMAADRLGEEPRGKYRRGKKAKAPETSPDIRLKAVEHGSVVVMAQKSVAEAKARKTTPDELDERW